MLRLLSKLTAAAVLGWSGVASAAVLSFEDLDANGMMPAGYAGFTWSNFATDYDADGLYDTGYDNGRFGATVAYNAFGLPSEVSMPGGYFSFQGAWFTAAWMEDVSLEITGFDASGNATHSETLILDPHGPQLLAANWSAVSRLRFVTSGGTPLAKYNFNTGKQFAMDVFIVNDAPISSPIPEPATWAMTIIGFGLAGSALRLGRRSHCAARA